jgi:hypothetical protein
MRREYENERTHKIKVDLHLGKLIKASTIDSISPID